MTAGAGGRAASSSLKVAAVQLAPARPGGARPVDWRELLGPGVERAAADGCGLVAFPSLPLPQPLDVDELAALQATASELARAHGVILVPGAVEARASLPDGAAGAEGPFLRQATVFGPDGSIIGAQNQTHVLPEDCERGQLAGQVLQVVALPPPAPRGLRLGLLVGLDAWYPEVGRILTMKGASLLVAPMAMRAPYQPWRQVAAMWQQAQQNQVFAIEACAVGRWGETDHAGRSAIIGPCEVTANGSGILAQAGLDAAALPVADWAAGVVEEGSTEPALVTAELDFEALQRVVDAYSLWEQQNTGFYRRVFPDLYERQAQQPDGDVDGERGSA